MNSEMTMLSEVAFVANTPAMVQAHESLSLQSDTAFRWFDSVTEIAPGDWARCFESSRFARSHSYQQAVEASAPHGVRFQYLVAYRENSVLAIVGCFRSRIPLSTTATGSARKVMSAIERLLPDVFSINAFFVGQLTAVCDHLFGLEQLEETQRSSFLTQCEPSIRQRAKELGSSVIIHKEIPEEDLAVVSEALGDDYVIASSLPAMELSLRSTEPYSKQLRKKYRVHYKRRQRLADERGLSWDVHRGPLSDELAENIERLYFQVLERSGTQFERLSASYFSSMMEHCPGASIVLCRDGERLVGFMINVESVHDFHGLYLGYDPAYRDAAVYFNLIYRSLDVALEQGYQSIHLGQTSYEIKSALGAKRTNLHLALRATSPIVHAFIKIFRKHLFPEVDVPTRRAFPVNEAG